MNLASNKVIYEFKIKKTLSLLHNNLSITNVFEKRLKFRVEIFDVIIFVNIKAKIYYDARHQLLLLNLEDKTYLRLNYDYYLLEKSSKKISLQRCDSFLIKKRIDRLVYFLELSFTWRIYLIVFVAQLKSFSFITNSYVCSKPNYSNLIEIENDTSQ